MTKERQGRRTGLYRKRGGKKEGWGEEGEGRKQREDCKEMKQNLHNAKRGHL